MTRPLAGQLVARSTGGGRNRAAAAAAEHAGDLVRMGLAASVFAGCLLAIQRGSLSLLERDLFRLVNDLPSALTTLFWPVTQLGTSLAPLVIGTIVLVAFRRVRMGLSIIAGGTAAWLTAQLVKLLVERPRPAGFLQDLPAAWSGGGPGFVSGHTAVAAGIAGVAAPYLPRRWRRVVWSLAMLVGFTRVASGVHLPLDIVGGAAIGWFVGTLVQVLVGSPRPERTATAVAAMLARVGIDVDEVQPADVSAEISHPFFVTTRAGRRLFVKVLDPDPRRSDWIIRLFRMLASRERRHVTGLDSLPAAADREAAATMAARSAGVAVPEVVLARGDGSAAMVVLEALRGADLGSAPADSISDELLRRVWREVAVLRAARIAHHDLIRANVLVDPAGHPCLIDFHDAEVGAADAALDADVAELLASLACAVGARRAVEAATAELGPAVTQSVSGLQPFALTARTRRELRDRPGLLDELRLSVGGSSEASSRLLGQGLVMPALAAAIGYGGILTVGGWSDAGRLLASTSLRWVGVSVTVLATASIIMSVAFALAARHRIAVGRSAAAITIADTAAVVTGPTARRQQLVAYLRSCGVGGDQAATVVELFDDAALVAAPVVVAGGAVLGVVQGTVDLRPSLPAAWLLAVAALIGFPTWLVRRRRRPFRARSTGLTAARSTPSQATAVVAAMIAAEVTLAMALAAALHAVGPAGPMATTAAALAASHLVLRMLGLAGAPAVEEATCAGLLCLVGIAPAHAVLGALIYGLLRVWGTGVAGLVASRALTPMRR